MFGRRKPAERTHACTDCGAAISLKQLAGFANRCARCWKDLEQRKSAERIAFEVRMANGSIYWPTEAEFVDARNLDEALQAKRWRLEPEVYRNGETVEQVLATIDAGEERSLILRCEKEEATEASHLVLATKGDFGACFFMDTMDSPIFFAHTSRAASGQVDADDQLFYCCPCCGVGMGNVPSRFHLPREEARGVLLAALSRQPPVAGVRWFEVPDLGEYRPGEG
jgi:hypothetical protein